MASMAPKSRRHTQEQATEQPTELVADPTTANQSSTNTPEESGDSKRKPRPAAERFKDEANRVLNSLDFAARTAEAASNIRGEVPDEVWERYQEMIRGFVDRITSAERPAAPLAGTDPALGGKPKRKEYL